MPKQPVFIHSSLMEQLVKEARISKRQRMNYIFHQLEDAANRILNPIESESYIQPHRHVEPPCDEASLVLRGLGAILLFNDDGVVKYGFVLDSASENLGLDIPAGWYHTIVSLERGSVFYEVKAGP